MTSSLWRWPRWPAAILETPESVWEPLTDAEKANLAKWLDTINHHDLPGCNWLLFRVLVNLALDSVGMPAIWPAPPR